MANNFNLSTNYAAMLSDPEFQKTLELQKQLNEGFAKGQALAQTIRDTPMQPEIIAEDTKRIPASIPEQFQEIDNSIFDRMQFASSPQEQQKLLYQLMSKSMQQQQEGVRQAQEAFKKEKERQANMGILERLDLRPFAEAAHSYGATSVAPVQAPEMTEMQRQDFLRKLQSQVQSAQEGMTKEQVSALRNIMDQKNTQAMLSLGNQEQRAYERVMAKFDKPQQQILDFYQNHDAIKAALDAGDVAAIQASLSNYSRMTGEKGVLTDRDIGRVITPTLSLKIAQWKANALSNPNTPAPKEIVDSLRKGIERLKEAAETNYKSKIEIAKNQGTKVAPAMYKKYAEGAYDQAKELVRPISGMTLKPNNATADVLSNEDKAKLEKEQLLKELKALQGE